MHSLMTAVVLRLARRNPLETDAEPHPPHRERRQPAQRDRRERYAVVRADCRGRPVLLKQAHEERPYPKSRDRPQGGAAEEETAKEVARGERPEVLVVDDELPLEVYASAVVGRLRLHEPGWGRPWWLPAAPPRLHQPLALQEFADRACRWQLELRLVRFEVAQHLARSPLRSLLTQSEQPLRDPPRDRPRHSFRSPRPVLEANDSVLVVPLKPLVTSLRDDAVRGTYSRKTASTSPSLLR